MLFWNEFLRDSSQFESIPPNIRNKIVSESRLTRRTSRLENFFLMKPGESPRIKKNQSVAIRAIRGLCGIGVYVKAFIVNVNKFLKPFFLEQHINIVNTRGIWKVLSMAS